MGSFRVVQVLHGLPFFVFMRVDDIYERKTTSFLQFPVFIHRQDPEEILARSLSGLLALDIASLLLTSKEVFWDSSNT